MKIPKICLCIIILLFSAILLFAEPVNIYTAESVAYNWLSRQNSVQEKYDSITFRDYDIYQSEGHDIFYIFNFYPEGWVIISADDAAYPVIGYNTVNKICLSEMKDNIKSFLKIHEKSIIHIKEKELENKDTIKIWNKILDNNFTEIEKSESVSPLLNTQWNQSYPWNAMCPEDADGSGGHVFAGCVAVAMVQVMKYWSHPIQGTGSHSYFHSTYGTISADFGNAVYNWDNMPNYTATEDTQLILFHAGVSVNMNYGPSGSGAHGQDARDAMLDFFLYDHSISFVSKSFYSHSDWIDLLKEQLDNGWPMYYQGYGDSYGHAFNCDGYDVNDLFHFNWGWGGAFDGYYNVNNLNPGGYNFSEYQSAIINMVPIGIQDPYDFSAIAVSSSQIDLSWQKNNDNDNVMIIWSYDGVFGIPEEGDEYAVGSSIPEGGTVLYKGSGNNFSHTGLLDFTPYYYKAFSYTDSYEYSYGIITSATTHCDTVIDSLPFLEDFDSSASLPECWEIIDYQGNGQVWQIGTMNGGLTGTTGNYAYIDSDGYGSGHSQNSDLITPVFDLSEYSEINLSFTHYFRQFQQASTATLSYSIDNGNSWINIETWTEDTANGAVFDQIIPGMAGQANVRIKWNYQGSWAYHWCIDDILLEGELSNDPPDAPSDLSASAVSESQIDLSWTDNSHNEQGFTIERKQGSDGSWAEIDTVGSDTVSYEDTGLLSNTLYYYRVRAYNSFGNSAYSNEASAYTHEEELDGVSVFRFFNTRSGGHLYTVSEYERDYIIDNLPEWEYEGISFEVYLNQENGTVPAYRFFNTNTGIHLYTISEHERDHIIDNLPEWNDEGISFFVYPQDASGTIPVFRFFNNMRGGHLYTISEYERDYIIDNLHDWDYEGISFYVLEIIR